MIEGLKDRGVNKSGLNAARTVFNFFGNEDFYNFHLVPV